MYILKFKYLIPVKCLLVFIGEVLDCVNRVCKIFDNNVSE